MAYIGKEPQVGNYQICDAISVVNGQAAYTMQVSSANVNPESANHMIVSLNGIIQKPGSSFTISGSTITFASNLVTNDVIDYIMLLGNVLDLGTPSDNTVTAAKIGANAVTGAKLNTDVISAQTALATAPADTDEFMVSDGGVLKRIDYSLIKGGGQWEFISATTISSGTAAVDFTTLSTDYEDFLFTLQNVHQADDGVRIYGRVFTGTGGSQAVVTGSNYGYAISTMTTGHSTEGTNSVDHMRFSYINGASTDESYCAEIVLYNPHGTTFQKFFRINGVGVSSANATHMHSIASKYDQTTAVTGVRFYSQSGDLDSGQISLFGRKNS
jgi:hypothetical protein